MHRQQRIGSEGRGEVKSKMDAATAGPRCLDFDFESPVGEGFMFVLYSNQSSRMTRLDNFKLRIRRGNTVDTASRRGPVVSVRTTQFLCMQNAA